MSLIQAMMTVFPGRTENIENYNKIITVLERYGISSFMKNEEQMVRLFTEILKQADFSELFQEDYLKKLDEFKKEIYHYAHKLNLIDDELSEVLSENFKFVSLLLIESYFALYKRFPQIFNNPGITNIFRQFFDLLSEKLKNTNISNVKDLNQFFSSLSKNQFEVNNESATYLKSFISVYFALVISILIADKIIKYTKEDIEYLCKCLQECGQEVLYYLSIELNT